MNLSEIVALLCNEPFCLRVDEAKRLTLFQVRKLYLRERNEYGGIKLETRRDEAVEQALAMKMLAHKAIRVPLWWVAKKDAENGFAKRP